MAGKLLRLASGSPQRAALITTLLDINDIEISPPREFIEPTLEDAASLEEVADFVALLAEAKATASIEQDGLGLPVLASDTLVVARDGDRYVVLGKPPEDDNGHTVKRWLKELLSGCEHYVLTGVCVVSTNGQRYVEASTTAVGFVEISDSMANWYESTGEPYGKAGGYAIQGHGSAFVESVDGSFTNVVGLPVWETACLLQLAGVPVQVTPES